MTPEAYQDALDKARQSQTFHRAINIILGLTTVVLSLSVFSLIGDARTVITPPVIDRPFWVTNNRLSDEYLEMMGQFVSGLVLDVSANSALYKRDTLLKFVDPSAHGDIRIRMDREIERLQRSNASTVFRAAQVTPDAKNMTVRLDGVLTSYINGKAFDQDASYTVRFAYRSTGLWLTGFDATPAAK
jgi:conjugal transfer pilus assembly protein TraE